MLKLILFVTQSLYNSQAHDHVNKDQRHCLLRVVFLHLIFISPSNFCFILQLIDMSGHDNEDLIDYEEDQEVGNGGVAVANGGAASAEVDGVEKKNFSGIHSTALGATTPFNVTEDFIKLLCVQGLLVKARAPSRDQRPWLRTPFGGSVLVQSSEIVVSC